MLLYQIKLVYTLMML